MQAQPLAIDQLSITQDLRVAGYRDLGAKRMAFAAHQIVSGHGQLVGRDFPAFGHEPLHLSLENLRWQ